MQDKKRRKLTIGPLFRSVVLMFTSIRNIVTSKAIRPGTISTGITNPMKEITVSKPVGRYVLLKKGSECLFSTSLKPLVEYCCSRHIE